MNTEENNSPVTFEDLISFVEEWGRKKGINNHLMQFAKSIEEFGELAHEVTRNHCGNGVVPTNESVDAIGDILVTVIIFADIVGIDIKEALAEAYLEISKRDGETINGSFIKNN